ncbi:hypothetical protein COSO111634_27475 [Corallococcus soli]
MNGVAFSCRASFTSPWVSSSGRCTGSRPPREERMAGRGLSVSSSRTCGAPASCSFHHVTSCASTSPWSHWRCHAAKSAYCTGSGGSDGVCPVAKAA